MTLGKVRLIAGCLLFSACSAVDVGRSPTPAAGGALVAVIPIERMPAGAVALSPDGNRAYVVGMYDLFVADTAARRVTRRTSIPQLPHAIAVSPDGTSVYVVALSGETVSILDSSAARIVATIDLAREHRPRGGPSLALADNGAVLYLAMPATDQLHLIDTQTRTVVRTVGLPVTPLALAAADDGAVFVAGCARVCTSTHVLRVSGNGALHELADFDEGAPAGLAVDSATRRLFVTMTDHLSVIDTASGRRIGPVKGPFGGEIAIVPGGRTLAVRDRRNGFSLLDAERLAVLGSVPLAAGRGLAISPDGRLAYAPSGDSLAVIDLTRMGATTGTHGRGTRAADSEGPPP